MDPLPYFPSLAKTLKGPTLSLVLTYLEFHHPSPQDPNDRQNGRQSDPVLIDCDAACADLGISRRTLHIAFSCLGCWWSTEEARNRAARAGREFLNPNHSAAPNGHGQIKIYSVTGSRQYAAPRILSVRRNYPKLTNTFVLAGLIDVVDHCAADVAISSSVHSVPALPAILAKVMPDWGDRRAERWDRWRRENGRKSQNPGRMRDAKKSVGSQDAGISIDSAKGCEDGVNVDSVDC